MTTRIEMIRSRTIEELVHHHHLVVPVVGQPPEAVLRCDRAEPLTVDEL